MSTSSSLIKAWRETHGVTPATPDGSRTPAVAADGAAVAPADGSRTAAVVAGGAAVAAGSFLDHMLEHNNGKLSDLQLIAQANTFTLAGERGGRGWCVCTRGL